MAFLAYNELLADLALDFVIGTYVLAVHSVTELEYYRKRLFLPLICLRFVVMLFSLLLSILVINNWFSGKTQKQGWIYLIQFTVYAARDVVVFFVVIYACITLIIPEYFHYHKLFYFEMKYNY